MFSDVTAGASGTPRYVDPQFLQEPPRSRSNSSSSSTSPRRYRLRQQRGKNTSKIAVNCRSSHPEVLPTLQKSKGRQIRLKVSQRADRREPQDLL